jgi:hypothetical protein
MLVHHIICFGALAALLASSFGIYYDAFKGGAIPAYVLNINVVISFITLTFRCFRVRCSISTSSGGNNFVLIYGLCSRVRLVIGYFIIKSHH